jgi:hypothetical protein
MTPRESFGVVLRSFGVGTFLYGLYTIAGGAIGAICFEAQMTGMNESFPLSAFQGATGAVTTTLTRPVTGAALALGSLACFVGLILIRWSSGMASFEAPQDLEEISDKPSDVR